MQKLTLMCGIPGSGKSTWLKNNILNKENCAIISRDEIRFSLLKERDSYFSKEDKVFEIFVKTIQNNIDSGLDVYIDATHLNKFSRRKILNQLKLNNISIEAIYFTTPLNICLERNQKRSGRSFVPDNVIKDMAKNYRFPSYLEGFNKIFSINEENIIVNE